MKRKTKIILRDLAKFFGLKIVFVHYFTDDIYGKLLVRERRILINARKPRSEHTFTLLHELGHYSQHVLRPPRKFHLRILDKSWKAKWLARLSSRARRLFRYSFNKSSGKEWQADVWAMCAFIRVCQITRSTNDFTAFIERHPEKLWQFYLASGSVFYFDIKMRIRSLRNFCLQVYRKST